jgi:hypothetical protein
MARATRPSVAPFRPGTLARAKGREVIMMKQTHLTLQRYDREMTEYRDHLKKHVQ